jgi:TonB-dependent receptor
MYQAIWILLIGVFATNLLYAQTGGVKGKLMSDEEETLPGANVVIEGTKIGTTTDMEGAFSLMNIPIGNQKIVVTYLGYENKIIPISIQPNETLNLGVIIVEEAANQLNEVVVRGELNHESESKAINLTKTSNKIITVISSEAIHKLPDKNAAEVVRRVPGATIIYNKGEGAYIALRGTPHDWTATLINGDRLPVADEENSTRSFEFEVLPSELIKYVIVTKTVTPDIEGDNIGGAINFLTRSSVEKKTLHFHLGTGYNVLAAKPTIDASFIAGNISKNKKFSYVVNGSYFGRYYGAQAYKLIYGNNFNHAINRFEKKNYFGMRNTIGANVAAEYKPTENIKIGGRFIYGSMLDDKNQQKQMYVYASGENDGLWLQNIHGKLKRQLMGGDIHSEFKIGSKAKLNVRLSRYNNQFTYGNVPFNNEDPRNGYFFAEFRQRRVDVSYADMVPIKIDGSFYDAATDDPSTFYGNAKLLDIDNPQGDGDNFRNIRPEINISLNPDSFEFRRAFSELNTTKERDPIVAQADFQYKIKNNFSLQFGYKLRLKEGERKLSLHRWEINPQVSQGEIFFMNRFDTEAVNTRGGYMRELGDSYDSFMPFLTRDALDNIVTDLGDTLREFEMNKINNDFRNWVGSYYTYREMQNAAYGMFEWRIGNINVVGGLRVEHTKLEQDGDTLVTSPENLVLDTASGNFYYEPKKQFTKQNYFAFLPALNISWGVTDKSNVRFAVSRTFHRTNFAETKPGFAVINFSDFQFVFGNPNLRPAFSWNFDLMYEFYWGNKGTFSIGTYYKYVTDHIYTVTTSDFDANSGIILKTYDNAGKSFVWGGELNFIRKFDFLPKALNGFGINANLTIAISEMQVPGRMVKQALAEQTPLLYNISLYYEKHGINARIGMNYTGAHLKELNMAAVKGIGLLHKDSGFDIFQGEMYTLDAQIGYTFKKKYTIHVEGTNLLNYKFYEYRGNKDRPIRIEYYRQRFQIGFKYEF